MHHTLLEQTAVKKLRKLVPLSTLLYDKKRSIWILNQAYHLLSDSCLAQWASFLECFSPVPGTIFRGVYWIFTFKPPHNLHLGILNLLNNLLVTYLSSEDHLSTRQKPESDRTRICMFRTLLLRGAKSMLAAIETHHEEPRLHVYLSKKGISSQLNGIFTTDGLLKF